MSSSELLVVLGADVSGFKDAMDQATQKVKQSTDTIGSETDKITKTFSQKAKSLSSSFTSVGKSMMTSFTLPIVAAGAVAVKSFADFETAMNKVGTIADTNAVPLKDLQKQITGLSSDMGIASGEIADATYQAISAGIDTASSVGFVADASKLAKAGFTDSASAVDVLTTALNSYGMGAEETSRISDILLQTQNKGKTTVAELSSSLGTVIPIASAANVNMEQLGSSMAIMTANGVATSESTTYLKSMFGELTKTGSQTDDMLKELTGKGFAELQKEGMSTGDVLAIIEDEASKNGLTLKDMFGSVEAGSAAMILAKNDGQDFNNMLGEMNNSAGVTDKAFQQMDEGIGSSLQKMKTEVQNLAISMGNSLAPTVKIISDKIKELSQWFNGLSDSQKETIVKILAVVAAIGPLLLIIGKVITVVTTVISIFSKLKVVFLAIKGAAAVLGGAIGAISLPVVAVIAVIAGLIAIGVALYKNWDEVKAWLVSTWTTIKTKASEIWTSITDTITQTIENAKKWIREKWESIKQITSDVWNAIVKFMKKYGLMILAAIVSPVGAMLIFIVKNWDTIKKVTSDTWKAIKSKISELVTAIVDKIVEFVNSIKQKFEEMKTAVVNKVKEMASDMKSKFVNGLTDLVTAAKEIPGKIGTAIKNAASNAVQGVKDLVTKIIDTFKSALGINSPSKVFTELGGYVIEGLKNGLSAENIKSFALDIFKDITGGAVDTLNTLKGIFSGGTLDSMKSFFSGLGSDIGDFFNGSIKAVGSGVDRWRTIAMQALVMTGQYSPANLERLLYQMQTESGGNPQAINLWDSNAMKGIPSKGLMQVIDPTFARYKQPGYNNIWNPLDNMLASINYAMSRYGSLANAYRGTGYATGGIFKGTQSGSLVRMAENGGDEAVVPLSNKSRMKPFAQAIAEMMGEDSNGKVQITNNFNIASVVIREEADIPKIAKALQREQERMDRAGGRVIYGVQI